MALLAPEQGAPLTPQAGRSTLTRVRPSLTHLHACMATPAGQRLQTALLPNARFHVFAPENVRHLSTASDEDTVSLLRIGIPHVAGGSDGDDGDRYGGVPVGLFDLHLRPSDVVAVAETDQATIMRRITHSGETVQVHLQLWLYVTQRTLWLRAASGASCESLITTPLTSAPC